MKEMQERIALQAEIQEKQAELSGLRGDIATAQEQLDSLVAQIGAASEVCEVYKFVYLTWVIACGGLLSPPLIS